MNRVSTLAVGSHQSVPGLMIGDSTLFLVLEPAAFSFRPRDYLLNRLFKILLVNLSGMPTCGKQGCFIDGVREVSAGKSRSRLCNSAQVDIASQGLSAHMNLQDCLSTFD